MSTRRSAPPVVKCRECGKVKTEHARELCFACYMREYRAQRRETENRVKPLIEALEETSGSAAEFPDYDGLCYWCSIGLGGIDANEPTVWFMDEPACDDHVELAREWIVYVTRKPLARSR